MPDPKLDLDALEAAVAAMTPGPLLSAPINGTERLESALAYVRAAHAAGAGRLHVVWVPVPPGDPGPGDHLIVAITGNGPTSAANASGIVTLHGAAPALIARAREADRLEARCAELREALRGLVVASEGEDFAEWPVVTDARAVLDRSDP